MDIFVKSLCKETIKLEPKFLNNRFKKEIIKRLKNNYEGICSNHGYIKKDSIEIYKIKPGIIELSTLSGFINYDVYFYADICNPLNKSIIQGRVVKSNRFGILVEAGYDYEDEFITILEIVVTKNSFNIVSDIDLNTLQIGDLVNVEILGKKYQLNDKTIHIIGRIVKDDVKSDIYYDKKEYHKELVQEDEFIDIVEDEELQDEEQTKNTDMDEEEEEDDDIEEDIDDDEDEDEDEDLDVEEEEEEEEDDE